MALDILHDNWGPFTHTEVENALKAYLAVLEGRINQAIQEGGVGLTDLSAEVQALLSKANTALQPGDIASWAKAQNKPGYTADEITGVEGFQNLLAKLQDMDAKIQAAAQSGDIPDDEMSSSSEKPVQNKVIKAYVDNLINGLINGAPAALDTLKELADALGNNDDAIAALTTAIASKISGIKANGASTTLPVDENGIVTLPPAGSTISPADTAPQMDGNTALVGSSDKYAREDHVHPHDSSKQDVLTFDDAPTAGHTTQVMSSDKIKTALDNLLTNLRIVNNEWYIGNTATGVSAQGPAGNVNITDASDLVAILVNDLTTGGAGNILSAEMGKYIKDNYLETLDGLIETPPTKETTTYTTGFSEHRYYSSNGKAVGTTWPLSGGVPQSLYVASAPTVCRQFNVKAGYSVAIWGKGYTQAALWVLLDSEYKILSKSNNGGTGSNPSSAVSQDNPEIVNVEADGYLLVSSQDSATYGVAVTKKIPAELKPADSQHDGFMSKEQAALLEQIGDYDIASLGEYLQVDDSFSLSASQSKTNAIWSETFEPILKKGGYYKISLSGTCAFNWAGNYLSLTLVGQNSGKSKTVLALVKDSGDSFTPQDVYIYPKEDSKLTLAARYGGQLNVTGVGWYSTTINNLLPDQVPTIFEPATLWLKYTTMSIRSNHDMSWHKDNLWAFNKYTDGNSFVYNSSNVEIKRFLLKFDETFKDSSTSPLQMKSADWHEQKNLLLVGNGKQGYSSSDSYCYIFYEAEDWLEATEDITFANCGEYAKIDFTDLGVKCYGYWAYDNNADTMFVSVNLFKDIYLVQLGKGTNDLSQLTNGGGVFASGTSSGKYNGSWVVLNHWRETEYSGTYADHGGQFYGGYLYLGDNRGDMARVFKITFNDDGTMKWQKIRFGYRKADGSGISEGAVDGLCIKDGKMYVNILNVSGQTNRNITAVADIM